jgi:hypothetical protein
LIVALLILSASGKVTKKQWSSEDPEVDDIGINVYKKTMRQYHGKTMDQRAEISRVLYEIHDLGWFGYYYNKHFNDPSESSDS